MKTTTIKERLKDFLKYLGIGQKAFEIKVGISNGYINNIGKSIGSGIIKKIQDKYPELNIDWLLTGTGEMLNRENTTPKESLSDKTRNFIPLYEDVATIGGIDTIANMDPVKESSIQIDAGDWFKGATAAIRHYGDSMTEYSSGCILAIRELSNKNEIVWGRNYVVETTERRITKQIAELDQYNIICYSTNTEKHPDGRLKHQPIIIPKEDIRYISRVLGSVNKEESTGKVQLL